VFNRGCLIKFQICLPLLHPAPLSHVVGAGL
jgi:hypothetical protein